MSGSTLPIAAGTDPVAGLGVAHRLVLSMILNRPPEPTAVALDALDDELAEEVARTARHHFVSGLLHDRIRAAVGESDADKRFGRLAADGKQAARRSLLISATASQIHREIMEPRGIRYVILKGIALAARYYGGIDRRACRDLDILVRYEDMEQLILQLLDTGFRLVEPFESPPEPDALRHHVAALAYLNAEVGLMSPLGILVEVHSRVDLTSSSFSTDGILARREWVEIAGTLLPVPATEDLFPFICYHHTRHEWSRLHWLADLDMIMRHPAFDPDRVGRRAREAGYGRLVKACSALPNLVRGALDGAAQGAGDGLRSHLAACCIRYADPAVPPPEVGRESASRTFLAYWHHRIRFAVLDLRMRDGLAAVGGMVVQRLRPTWGESSLVLPRHLFWVYWIVRPFRVALGNLAPGGFRARERGQDGQDVLPG